MILYLLSMSFASMLAYMYEKTRTLHVAKIMNGIVPRLLIFASALIIIILGGTRINVGTDYSSYVDIFRGVSEGYRYNLEHGFIWLNQVVLCFTNNPQWMFFVTTAITTVLIYRFIVKYSVNIAYSVFLYFGLCLIFFSYNTLRQFIAIGIVLLTFGPLLNRQFWRYAAIVAVASLFHLTALFMLPMYFVLNARLTKMRVMLFAVLAAIIYASKDVVFDLFFTLYPQHRDNAFLLDRVNFSEIMIATPIILLVMIRYLMKRKLIHYSGKERIYVNAVFFILFTHIAFAWVPGMDRVVLYLDVLLLVIVPYVLNKFPVGARKLLLVLSIIYFSSYAFISTYVSNSHNALPYNSVLIPDSSTYGGMK